LLRHGGGLGVLMAAPTTRAVLLLAAPGQLLSGSMSLATAPLWTGTGTAPRKPEPAGEASMAVVLLPKGRMVPVGECLGGAGDMPACVGSPRQLVHAAPRRSMAGQQAWP
jgi:hypothetical protein